MVGGHLLNESIPHKIIKLIVDEDKKEMSLTDAISLAEADGLDVVLVSDKGDMPICKLMNYEKYLYNLKKAQKKPKQTEMKEIRLGCNIAEHDISIKVENARRILDEGDKVKFVIVFKGRQISMIDSGINILNKIATDITDIASVSRAPKIEGKICTMIVENKH